MSEKPYPEEPDNIACEVCLKEIPQSVAASHEGDEYAHHFCGTECYNIWKQRSGEDDTGNG